MARKHQARSKSEGGGAMTESRPGMMGNLMERMERFLENPWEALYSTVQPFEPRFDLEQTAKDFVITARLPGYNRDDIDIDLTEDSITLRGCKSSSKESGKEGRYEEQSFVRSMSLPASVKVDGAKASFKGDKLEIRLPRAKETNVRRLDVQT